jgi:cystathionine beta-synthase
MKYLDNILQAIGRTPLVRLSKVTDGLPVTLLAKVEHLNPGGSSKDRIDLVEFWTRRRDTERSVA